MKIALVKQTDARLSDDDKTVLRRFLFEHISGATDKDTKAWNRFVRAMDTAAQGEYFVVELARQRVGKFHRRHMALMTKIFKAQERVDDFEGFRLWAKVGSGFILWMPGARGGVFPVPRSINFNTCSEEDFREFHDGVIAFLRTAPAIKYLWPNVSPQVAEQGLENILAEFKE